MLLQIPLLIAAGLAVAASFAAAWKAGGGDTQKAPRRSRRTPREYPSLTLKEFFKRHLSTPYVEPVSVAPESEGTDGRKPCRWIRLLNLSFFPLCAGAYATSFLFDLHEAVRFVSVSGMIGYGTNWLAVTMLFHPRRRHVLLGQGLIPRQREEIVEALAEGVFRNLINEDIIKRQMEKSGLVTKITRDFKDKLHDLCKKPEFREDLRLLIATAIREFIQSPVRRAHIALLAEQLLDRLELRGIAGQLLNWSRPVWRESALKDLDRWIESELPAILDENLNLLDDQLAKLPAYMEHETDAVEHWVTSAIIYFVKRLDIKKTVRDQLRTLDEKELERMIQDASNDQLAHITLLGGLLGMMAGLVLWNPTAIAWIVAAGICVIAVDAILTRLLRRRAVNS